MYGNYNCVCLHITRMKNVRQVPGIGAGKAGRDQTERLIVSTREHSSHNEWY